MQLSWPALDRNQILERFRKTRRLSARLCEPLAVEDYVVQTMPDASPAKWHLGHTTWFFENFILSKFESGFEPFHARFNFLFNSYYESQGERVARPDRGLCSRPTVQEVYSYRNSVEEHLELLLRDLSEEVEGEVLALLEIGIHHEQQHQELILTDLKHCFFMNALRPDYRPDCAPASFGAAAGETRFLSVPGGTYEIGHDPSRGFAYDNECPRHAVLLQDFAIASRPVTCGEYLAFIEDGGYQEFRHWLSDGWARIQAEGWRAPLYWEQVEGTWKIWTLTGARSIDPDEPVTHVSYYEALAFASWAGCRLATEQEWEIAADRLCPAIRAGNFLDQERYHPARASQAGEGLQQMFGDVWEWTGSAYLPYPGYRPLAGALGEYNGKFMIDQMVLRGGSCATPADHIRSSYRNFFQPYQRWQFSGFRLARDA